jgi:hypothetical protein
MSGIVLALAGRTTGPPPLAIGDAYQGGYYAGQISTTANGVATHNLVVSPKSSGNSYNKKFKTSRSSGDSTNVIDGPSNSAAMNSATYPAAQFCEGLSIGGYSDWYLPASAELFTLYYFLKITADSNATSYGSTAYAVAPQPISTNFALYSPTITTATLFQNGQSEAFEYYDSYWSSSQYPSAATAAVAHKFPQGNTDGLYKDQVGQWVRAIRRVAV